MTSWRDKNDQELTAADIREMRAEARDAEGAKRDVERYALENQILRERLNIIIDSARAVPEAGERAAVMMGNLRETQEWRDGAMMLGLASEVSALRAEIRRMIAEHDALATLTRRCPRCFAEGGQHWADCAQAT